MASGVYNFTPYALNGDIDINSNNTDARVMLVKDTYTFNASDTQYTDISSHEVSGTNYTAGGELLSKQTVGADLNYQSVEYNIVSWSNVTISDVRYAIIYVNHTGTDYLCFCYDFGATDSYNNENIEIEWPLINPKSWEINNVGRVSNGVTADIFMRSANDRWLAQAVPFDTANFKLALMTSSYSRNYLHDAWDDISTNEVSGGGYAPIAFNTTTSGTLVSDSVSSRTFSGLTNVTFRHMVMYKDTGVASSSYLVATWDFGSDITITGNFTVDWQTANQIISFVTV